MREGVWVIRRVSGCVGEYFLLVFFAIKIISTIFLNSNIFGYTPNFIRV
jgi:hypothetical protein